MATKNMSYDHPTYVSRNMTPIAVPAVAASTSGAKFLAFSAIKIKRVGAIVAVAGTATGAGWDILNGTTSVGGITAGTSVANSVLTPVTTDITLASDGYLDIKTKAASATLRGDFMIEWEFVPGADVTA